MLNSSAEVKRPDGTKIHKHGDHYYVYHVTSAEYVKDKRYVVEKRKCVGKLIDKEKDLMCPNDNFEIYYPDKVSELVISYPAPPVFSDTLKVGSLITIRTILDQLEIRDILERIYGKDTTDDIIDIISYIETGHSSAFQHYPSFMRDHLQLGKQIRGDSYISKLLRENITDENINEFLRQWNKLHIKPDVKIYVSFDGSNFNWEARNSNTYKEFGHAKDNQDKPQVNIHLALKHDDGLPLDYDTYNGSINDMSQCKIMVERLHDFGYKNIGCIFDRGYYFEDVIRWLDKMEYPFIMMAVENRKEIRELIRKNRETLLHTATSWLDGLDVCGITTTEYLFDKERFFHIYYDDVQAGKLKRVFMNNIGAMSRELEELKDKPIRSNATLSRFKSWFVLDIEEQIIDKTPTGKTKKTPLKEKFLRGYHRKEEKIQERLDSFGFFCILTAEPLTAAESLQLYRFRDIIEKLFRSIKWGDDFSTPGVHTDEAFDAKMHLLFITSIVYSTLAQFSRKIKAETGNKRDYTVPGMIDLLEGIQCTINPSGVYKRRYAITAKQKLILEKAGITDSVIDNEIAHFNVVHKDLLKSSD